MTMGAVGLWPEFAGDDSEPEHEPVTWKAASTHLTIASLAFCAAAIIPAIIEPQRALEALLYVSGGLAVAVSVRFGSLRLARHAFFVAPPVLSFGQLLVLAAVPSAALEERVDGLINNTLLGALRIASMSFAYGACFVYAPIGDRAVAGLAGATIALGAANTALVGARVESAEARAFVLTMLPLLNMLPFVCGVLMRPLLRHVWGIERGRADPLDNVEKAAGSPGARRGRVGGRVVARRTAVEGDPSSEVSSLPTSRGRVAAERGGELLAQRAPHGDAGGGGGASASGGGSPDGRRPAPAAPLQAGGRRTAALRCPTAPRRARRGGAGGGGADAWVRCAERRRRARVFGGGAAPAPSRRQRQHRRRRRGGSRRSSSLHSSSDILEAQARQRGRASPTDVDNGDAAAAAAPALAGWPASGLS